MTSPRSLHAFFPNYYDGTRVSYSLKAIVDGMRGAGERIEVYVLGRSRDSSDAVHALLPMPMYRRTSALLRRPCQTMVARFGGRLQQGDVAYFWLTNPVTTTRRLQDRGVVVVREMINCTLERRRQEMEQAYRLLGMGPYDELSDADVAHERTELLAADAVFCPNACVLESVRAYGVAESRCIRTSYGWSPDRLAGHAVHSSKVPGTSFLFVGSGDVRKGLPGLLQAWERAAVPGRLLIAGRIDAQVRGRFGGILARPDVVELGHVDDIGAVYRSSDVFCFPSWEEGGPMVTIEAMGLGLPCIVTPMGSAGIVSAQSGGGVIVAPGDIDAMASAMRRLAGDPELRARLGREAALIAQGYTWEAVGRQRAEALRKFLGTSALQRARDGGDARSPRS